MWLGLTLYLLAMAVSLASNSEICLMTEPDFLFGEKNDEFLERLLSPITRGHKKLTAHHSTSDSAIQKAEKAAKKPTAAKGVTIIIKKSDSSSEMKEQDSPSQEYSDQTSSVTPELSTTFEPQRKFYNRFANGGLTNIENIISLFSGNFRVGSRSSTRSTPESAVSSVSEEVEDQASALKKLISKFSVVIKNATVIQGRLEKNADEAERLDELQRKILSLEQNAKRIRQRCKSEKSSLKTKKERYVFQLEGLKRVLRKQVELEKAVSRVLDEVQQTTGNDWEPVRLARLRGHHPGYHRRIPNASKG